jgi:hypothetical protein
MSFLEQFPSECSQHIFSYLQLAECLSLGSSSSSALREVLPDLCVRRNRMKQRYAVVTEKNQPPLCCSPTSIILHPTHQGNTPACLVEKFALENSQTHGCIVFPTVQDRVEQLALKVPLLHPLHGLVQDLCQSLRLDFDEEDLLAASISTATLIDALKQITCPLKLHSAILKGALHNDGLDSSSTELYQYIGDVLCVTYLMYDGNSNCSFAEGSPSSFVLAEKICQAPPSCYRSWVLMHASILRTKQFSERARSRLGVVGPSESILPDIEDAPNAITPRAMAHMYSRRSTSWSMPMDCYRTEAFMASVMVLIYDDFGPLGPSFRGRDIVQVREVSAHSMLACFTTSNDGTAAGREALEWLCLAHEQSVKARPMSVRTPVLRFG